MALNYFVTLLLIAGIASARFTDDTVQVSEEDLQEREDVFKTSCDVDEFLKLDGPKPKCVACTVCSEFMYERAPCTDLTNTICGWCGSKTAIRNSDFKQKCLKGSLPFIQMELKSRIMRDRLKYDGVEMSEDEENNLSKAIQTFFRLKKNNEATVEEQDESNENELYETEEIKEKYENEPTEIEEDVKESNVDAQVIDVFPQKNLQPMPVRPLRRLPLRLWPNDFEVSDDSDDSSDDDDELNEQRIKWDEWIDDQVKLIPDRESAEEPDEAEEITEFETFVIVADKAPLDEADTAQLIDAGEEDDMLRIRFFTRLILFFIFFAGILIYCCRAQRRPENRVILLDPQDYQILNHCSERASKINEAEKNIHENPLFVA